MREDEKRSTFHGAVDLLVGEVVAQAAPRNPGAYASTVRTAMLNDLRHDARTLMSDGDWTADELAAALRADAGVEQPNTAVTPTIRHVSQRNACPTCGCYEGRGWMPAPDRDDTTGVIGADLTPCPTCAADRHRTSQHHGTEPGRWEGYVANVARLRERHERGDQ